MSPVLQGGPREERRAPSATVTIQGSGEAPPTALSKDAIFDILRSSRRRGVLHYLHGPEEEVTIGTLAEHIAAVENDIEREALSSAQRKRVYIALYQCHLPKMADYGVIEYDDRGTVRLHPSARILYPYLYLDPDRPRFSLGETSGPVSRLRSFLGMD